DVSVGVGLQRLEGQLVRVVRKLTEGDVEVLVLAVPDAAAGPGDLGNGVGDGAVVRLDRCLELGGGHLSGPAVLRGDQHTEDRVVGGQEDLHLGGRGGVLLVGDAEGEHAVRGSLGVALGVEGDVREGRTRRGEDTGGGEGADGGGAAQSGTHRGHVWGSSVLVLDFGGSD